MKAVVILLVTVVILASIHAAPPFPQHADVSEVADSNHAESHNQSFAGIVQQLTFKCGTKSFNQKRDRHRQKRYVLQGSRWKVNPVTYNITKYPPDREGILKKEDVDKDIASAFKMWEEVTNLTIKRVFEGKVNIEIRFEVGNHGDDEPFDGRGGMTAHAYYPSFGGDIHFDADELWTSRSSQGINLFQVATHEIGHALGLEHTDDMDRTVMSPYYVNYDLNFKLHRDDITGIQYLYGKRTYSVCEYSRIDAATMMIDGATYLFRGNLVYKFDSFEGPQNPDYPKQISKAFEGLSGPLDAALTRSNGISYFFKGEDFWRFTNMTLDDNFPQKISEYFPDIPTPIDAAVVLPTDDNIYFLKGNSFWKYDHTRNPSVDLHAYPKSISREWKGIPSNLDAALRIRKEDEGQWETYFFRGDKYWKFNDRSLSVYVSNPPYPRPTRALFTGCNSKR